MPQKTLADNQTDAESINQSHYLSTSLKTVPTNQSQLRGKSAQLLLRAVAMATV